MLTSNQKSIIAIILKTIDVFQTSGVEYLPPYARSFHGYKAPSGVWCQMIGAVYGVRPGAEPLVPTYIRIEDLSRNRLATKVANLATYFANFSPSPTHC